MLLLSTSLLIMSGVMLLGWCWQQHRRNAGVVDVLWAFLLAFGGVAYAVTGAADWPTRWLVGGLMFIWYGSLGWHLARRLNGKPEEGRYAYLREHWGRHAGRWHLLFFQGQALLAWLFTLPAWFVTGHTNAAFPVAGWQLLLACILVGFAWWGERIADAQLAAFKRQHQSGICRQGLWRYSRHPNYFFEWLQWFVWPLLGWQYPGGFLLLLAPLVMWLFLYWGTGIPYTEQQSLRRHGDAYRAYQSTTNAFIPGRPKT